jgi:hypothetical protein
MKVREVDPKSAKDMEWLKSFRSSIVLANKAIISDALSASEYSGSKAYPVRKMQVKCRGRGPRPNRNYQRELPLGMSKTWAVYLTTKAYHGTPSQRESLMKRDEELMSELKVYMGEGRERAKQRRLGLRNLLNKIDAMNEELSKPVYMFTHSDELNP